MSITGSLFLDPTMVGVFTIPPEPRYEFYLFPYGFPQLTSGSAPTGSSPVIPTVGQVWPRGNR